jgi:hypothetical protein
MYQLLTEKFDGERHGNYHCNIVPSEASNYFKFCTVRSPYNKLASAWSFIQNKDAIHREQVKELMKRPITLINFMEWVAKERGNMLAYALNGLKIGASLTPTHIYIDQRLSGIKMDAHLQIENIDTQFSELPFVDEKIDVPKVFSMSGNDYYTTWDDIAFPEVIALANKWAGEDFDRFGYNMI